MAGSAPAISISQIGQIAINVHDTQRAIAFYRDILGLRLLFTAGHLAVVNHGLVWRSLAGRPPCLPPQVGADQK